MTQRRVENTRVHFLTFSPVSVKTRLENCFKTIQGWIFPWMEWTYAEADVSDGYTSEILDIYGYFLFAAPFMTMIPGFINKMVESWTGSRRSS